MAYNESIKLVIIRLYEVLEKYKIKDFTKVDCFDHGSNIEELAGISNETIGKPACSAIDEV